MYAKGNQVPGVAQLHGPVYPRRHRPSSRRHLQGLSPAALMDSSHDGQAAIGHALWRLRGRGHWLPATKALLHIRVVTLGFSQ
jgi:hypothetical protein